MSTRDITDELVRQVASELRERHGLDDDDLRTLGERLTAATRSGENQQFAECFVGEHRETFDRLAQ